METDLSKSGGVSPEMSLRLWARALSIEQASKTLGPGALASQILELAERFYPFLIADLGDSRRE